MEHIRKKASDRGFSDLVINLGHSQNTEVEICKAYADTVVTVCIPNHNTFLRLSDYRPLPQEYLLLNKIAGESYAAKTATVRIREIETLRGKVIPVRRAA